MAYSTTTKGLKPFRYFSKTSRSFLNKLSLFLLVIFVTSSCAYDDVTFYGVEGLNIEKLDMQGATVSALVRVENPNNYKIKVSSSDADLFLNGSYGGKATLLDPIVIPANYNGTVKTRMKAEFDKTSTQILPIFLSITMKRSVDIQIKGKLKAKSFLIGKNIDFDIIEHAEF